jgi:hypothetical protein
MDLLEKNGTQNDGRKSEYGPEQPAYLCETDAQSLADTERWVSDCAGRYQNTAPILTPPLPRRAAMR